MKKRKFSLDNRLFKNNKFLFLVSLLVSICIWVYISMGSANDTALTITNIPIQIELSDDARQSGLQVFSGADNTASVMVSGNRAVLGSISSSDITVTAVANVINSAGEYNLSVSAAKTNPSSNFQIASKVTPTTISVFVDYLRESTFQIQESVVYKVSEGFYASTSLANKSIVISGPQSQITKIAKVSAVAEIDGTINSSSTANAKIVLYDSDDNEISNEMLNMEMTTVEAVVSVFPEKSVQVLPEFLNKPEGLEITPDMISIDPDSIMLAGPKEILDKTDSVQLEPIDLSTLKNEKKNFQSLGINIPGECKNISNSTTANVTLDLSKLSRKNFTVTKFYVNGLSPEYKAQVTQKSVTVTVIGPKAEINSINPNNISAIIETSDFQGTLGSVQLPIRLNISGTKQCWAYGSYKANLTISEK